MRYRNYRYNDLNTIWVIMAINFLVFVATMASRKLFLFLALQPASFMDRPWTIITNLFVHGGMWHITANMLTLFFFGSYVIRLIGTINFLLIYFLGGIFGNILFMLLASPYSMVVGASGAIFALEGLLVLLAPQMRVVILPIPAPIPLWVAVIGGFLLMSLFPGVAWQGHLGGLIIGLIAGVLLRNRVRPNF